jgi:ATP-dependent Clp protease ATP-binding subunit ClpC
MVAQRKQDELSPVCRHAESLAARRRERVSTAHLLIALCAESSIASALLSAHRVSAARVAESLGEGATEEEADLARRLLQSARELAGRTRGGDAAPHHLLLALLGERKSCGYQMLERSGADLGRLRNAAMQVAVGAVSPRRLIPDAPAAPAPAPKPLARPSHHRPAQAVAVSLVPKPRSTGSQPPPPMPETPAPISQAQSMPVAPSRPVTRPAAAKPLPRTPASDDARLVLDPKKFPVLSAIGRNLTLAAARGELTPVIGREPEIERCLDVLAKRHANNPVLLGAPGVGKTSMLRGVAAAVASASPGSTDARIVVEISVAELVAGTPVRGALAERLASIKTEVAAAQGQVVLAFDEIHLLFTGAIDEEAGADLRLALARGELPCIGTSTPEDYRRVVEQDPQLARRFSAILIDEPTPDEARAILASVSEGLAGHHRVTFPVDVQSAAIEWTVRYAPGRALPDKAISVLDLAGARSRRRGQEAVSLATVASVVSEITDVPEERMLETDGARMLALETTLAGTVVGHAPMLARIAAILRRNAAGIRGRRPIGTFLLLGPTGVGKTETAKAVAKALFQSPDAMTRLDLSEYAEAHAIARMIGAPPGYVGHEAGGQLTEAVRRRPYQVVLLDEIEKAHRDVLEALLQVLDEGRMTDGRGRTVDFTNAVIMMTSNLGAAAAIGQTSRRVGFRSAQVDEGPRADHEGVLAAAREALPPELYNRIDEVMVFEPLQTGDVREIARRLLADLSRMLEETRGITLSIDDAVPAALLGLGGYDAELGARPMKRAIAKHVEAPLAELILRGTLGEGDEARVVVGPRGAIEIVPPADDSRVALPLFSRVTDAFPAHAKIGSGRNRTWSVLHPTGSLRCARSRRRRERPWRSHNAPVLESASFVRFAVRRRRRRALRPGLQWQRRAAAHDAHHGNDAPGNRRRRDRLHRPERPRVLQRRARWSLHRVADRAEPDPDGAPLRVRHPRAGGRARGLGRVWLGDAEGLDVQGARDGQVVLRDDEGDRPAEPDADRVPRRRSDDPRQRRRRLHVRRRADHPQGERAGHGHQAADPARRHAAREGRRVLRHRLRRHQRSGRRRRHPSSPRQPAREVRRRLRLPRRGVHRHRLGRRSGRVRGRLRRSGARRERARRRHHVTRPAGLRLADLRQRLQVGRLHQDGRRPRR